MYIIFNIIIALAAIFFILRLIVHTGLKVLQIMFAEPQSMSRKTEWTELETPQKDFDALKENRCRAAEIEHKYYGPITAHYSPQSIRAARQKRLTQIDGRWQVCQRRVAVKMPPRENTQEGDRQSIRHQKKCR